MVIKVNIHFKNTNELTPHVRHAWQVFCKYAHLDSTETTGHAELTIGFSEDCDIRLSETFQNNLTNKIYDHQRWFSDEPLLRCADGSPDYLGTAFYLVNCIQEYADTQLDYKNRFQFENSFQHTFNCAEETLVSNYFNHLIEENGFLKAITNKPNRQSKIFLTHDIDKLYWSFHHDGFWALKRGRFDIILKLIFFEIVGRQEWKNVDKIMAIEDEHDVRSVFFWLVNKGKVNKLEFNADYSVKSQTVQRFMSMAHEMGFENGIHKSISDDSFEIEIDKLGFQPLGNRYHHLKFNLPVDFPKIERSGLKLDCSLGFAEKYGFRNSYGLPVRMFNPIEERPYNFVQASLHLMDNTFRFYNGIGPGETWKRMLDFLEKNNHNSVITILWHNTFFTRYKFGGYIKCYKNLLDYMRENNINSVSMKEIIEEYG